MKYIQATETTSWHTPRVFGVWLLTCIVVVTAWAAQVQKVDQSKTEEVLQRVKQGQFLPADLNWLAQAGIIEAIPFLRERFSRTQGQVPEIELSIHEGSVQTAAIASALVRLGEKDSVYWDFLVDQARVAVESDAPSLIRYDSEGKSVRGQLSQEFVAWAKARNLDVNVAGQVQLYINPNLVTLLGITGDTRGTALLRRGLSSPNYLTEAAAAKGLAKLQDKESIPLIVEACRKAPAEAAYLIARALVFFDDPRAQVAAETFITDKKRLESLRKLIREKGADPFLL